MRNLLLIGLVIVTSQTYVQEAEAGLFGRNRCSNGRVRIFQRVRVRSRCQRVFFSSCCNSSRSTIVQSTPTTTGTGPAVPDTTGTGPAAPDTTGTGPAAPDTTTNQQVPEVAPAPPIRLPGVDESGPPAPAPAVQSSRPEEATTAPRTATSTPPPAPTLEKPEPTDPPFQLLNPNRNQQRVPQAPSPFVTPTEEDVTPSKDFNLFGGSITPNFHLLGTGGSSSSSSPFLLVRSP